MLTRVSVWRRPMCLCRVLNGSKNRRKSTKAYLSDSLSPTQNEESEANFKLQKILLLRKVTRYEFEKKQAHTDSEDELKDKVTAKGSNYAGLLERHDDYMFRLTEIQQTLAKMGLSVKVIKRHDYTVDQIDWADAVFTAGGDGTFLMAASKVEGHSKPVIGINTDPTRSEGYLCLPKQYSTNFTDAMEGLLTGKFKWMWRQRIRLTMGGAHTHSEQFDLHDQEIMYPEHRFWEHVKENEMYHGSAGKPARSTCRKLPVLALNEVFIGESLAARVSFYEMSVNDSVRVKQKSSGVTVCTGTGSTSWHFNINHVPRESVAEILQLAHQMGKCKLGCKNGDFVDSITEKFNKQLSFDPRLLKMAYTTRDPVPHGIYQVPHERGFCQKICVKSRMWDGWVVVDGGMSFRFNDGATLYLEMLEEDALRCVQL